MSYTKQLLYSIADTLSRNRKEMDPYISILQKNWYDSQESLRSLTINDYDRFDIPRRLSNMIIERVGSQQQGKQQQQYQYQSSKMEEEISIVRVLEQLRNRVRGEKFGESVDTLIRIFRNVRENITQDKFRLLKKSNQKIGELISLPENCQVLAYGGFEDCGDTLCMKNVAISRIDDCLESLSKFDQRNQFDPYKSQITSLLGNPKIQGETSVIFNEKLLEEERKREQIMSRPIRDREVKIYREIGKELKPDQSWNDERQLNETQREYAESIRAKLKSYGEDPKFMNRRKQEYYQLIKKPCFSETLVRVKLPDNWIFQCKFAPLEPLQQLVNIFHEYVENKNLSYYLYMTPPVEKLNGLILRQSFYERGCVPRAIFYFGSDEKLSGNILRQKKASGFSMFG